MNTSIHYVVKTKYWRREVPNVHDEYSDALPTKEDIAESSTVFRNASPILARAAAFSHYFSILEVLHDGIGKEQTTDAQARIDLQVYLDSGNAVELGGKGATFKSSPDLDKGISLYMVIDNSSDESVEMYLIHGIRYLEYLDRFDAEIQESLEGLRKEYSYYEEHGIEIGNKYIEELDLNAIGGDKVSIIRTPFDWEQLVLDYEGLDLFAEW
ncbi:hypothetical protein [Bizionia paragorgiae]|uniref:Uncharacterized protein n=1 Tax=Bizionia paragorgiae TaxID=283786 RepID=A0A1H4B8L9_BIZPA|nr:hypothetical protein [Bizionia paragorgiae]SEA44416.1 hypothetical protein SAMN04487990_11389 [Bizionia paragorgiae]